MNLMHIIYSEKDEFLRGREASVKPYDKEIMITHIVPEKFRGDITALTKYVGEASFESGLCIEVSLFELLGIIPRKRKRKDAYAALIKYLKDERNITLIIKSK